MITRSKLQAALKRMQDRPKADPLQQILGHVAMMKGEKGDKGERGEDGKTPQKGVDYFTESEAMNFLRSATPRKGKHYVDGRDGRDGRDGKDGNANIEEVRTIAEDEVRVHEKVFDHRLIHDKKVLGKLTLDESSIAEGKIFQVQGNTIVCIDLPKVPQVPLYMRGGGGEGHSRYRIKTITSSTTLDPLDQVILIDASAGNITLTIYSTEGNEGSHHFLKRIDTSSNTVSFAMTGSDTLDAETVYQLVNFGSGAEIFGDGTSKWYFKHA